MGIKEKITGLYCFLSSFSLVYLLLFPINVKVTAVFHVRCMNNKGSLSHQHDYIRDYLSVE